MDQVEQSENYQALSSIIGEQQRQLAQAPVNASQPVIEAAHGELPLAAKEYLSRAIAVLSGPNTPLARDPVPLLARAGALIAFELARVVRIRRGVTAGEFIASVFLEEAGSDLVVQAYRGALLKATVQRS